MPPWAPLGGMADELAPLLRVAATAANAARTDNATATPASSASLGAFLGVPFDSEVRRQAGSGTGEGRRRCRAASESDSVTGATPVLNPVQQAVWAWETTTRIAIIGTGFAGLGMAIRLKQEGIEDFVVLEKADDVGGTWRENTYPGVQCDVPSHLYSFSFAPNPKWTRTFPLGDEIRGYLRDCAQRYGVLPHIRFGREVRSAEWDDDAQRWTVETTDDTA